MERFQFTDDLLTGIDDIDGQHRMLFEIASDTLEPLTEHAAEATLHASLAFLSAYVRFHFAAEEYEMQRSGYPELARHSREHAEFRGLISSFLEQTTDASGMNALRERLGETVSRWLTRHIRIADKELAKYLREYVGEKGVSLASEGTLLAAGMIDARLDEVRPR